MSPASRARAGGRAPSPHGTRDTEPGSGATDDLLLALHRLGRLMGSRQVSARIADAAGVAVGQQGVQILRELRRNEELPIAALARAAHMDLAAVSRQLGPLEEVDLVRRTPSTVDARVALVSLTPEGRRVAERIHAVGLGHLDASLDRWSVPDVEQLASLLGRLIEDLQRTEIGPPEAT